MQIKTYLPFTWSINELIWQQALDNEDKIDKVKTLITNYCFPVFIIGLSILGSKQCPGKDNSKVQAGERGVSKFTYK